MRINQIRLRRRYKEAEEAAASFDPTALEDYGLLLVADETYMTKDENDRIEKWDEINASEAFDILAFADAYKPTWVSSGPNSKPEVEFGLDSTTTSALRKIEDISWMDAADALVVVVVRLRSAAATLSMFDVGGKFKFERRFGGAVRASINDGSTTRYLDTAALGTTNYTVLAMRITGGKLGLSVDGGSWTESAATSGLQDLTLVYHTISSFTSGASNDGFDIPFLAGGKWSEVGTAFDASVAGDLMTYYGIS